MRLDENGLQIDELTDILAELIAGYREIYGADLQLSQDTPDGQRVGIEAKARHDLQELALLVYNSFDPDLATGKGLRSIAKLAGITPRPGGRTLWELEVETNRKVDLPAGFTVETDGNKWETPQANQLLAPGTHTVTFQSVEWGSVPTSTGATFEILTPVLGVVGVDPTSTAFAGSLDETEPEFRQRRWQSVQKPSHSTAGGLTAKLLDLPGVIDAVVYENPFPVQQFGLPPHSIWPVILGGDRAAIAQVIAVDRTAGCVVVGGEEETYTETLTRADGTTFPIYHSVKFDRPEGVCLYLQVTATKRGDDQVDAEAINAAICARKFHIGESVQANQFYGPAYSVGTNYVLTNLKIKTDDGAWTDGEIAIARGQILGLTPDHVMVTVV